LIASWGKDMSNSIQKTEVTQGLDILPALKHKATLSENSVPKVNYVEPANDPKKICRG